MSAEDAELKTDAQDAPNSALPEEPVPFERIKHLLGVFDGPGDLSTNPKYMDGSGESSR